MPHRLPLPGDLQAHIDAVRRTHTHALSWLPCATCELANAVERDAVPAEKYRANQRAHMGPRKRAEVSDGR